MIYRKTLVVSFIFLLVFIFSPLKTSAQSVDVAQLAKEYGTDIYAWGWANGIIKKFTAQTVDWINSGFQGSPFYVQDTKAFFLGIANDEVSNFLSNKNISNICAPFRAKLSIALAKNYIADRDNKKYTCSLDILRNNYDDFMNDFDQGGWDAWFDITQNPENNPYGAYMESVEFMGKNIGKENEKFNKQMDWGRGFLSFSKCPAIEERNPSTGKTGCVDETGIPVQEETVTPGSVIQEKLNKALNSSENRLEVADELDEVIQSLFEHFMGKLYGGTMGLLGLTRDNTTRDLEREIEGQPTGYSGRNPSTGDLTNEACAAAPEACQDSAAVTNIYNGGSGSSGGSGEPPPDPPTPPCEGYCQ